MQMEKAEIENLTKAIESGNGCQIKSVVHEMPFEESLKTLKAIEDQNAVNRQTDSSLPNVDFFISGDNARAIAKLAQRNAIGYPTIYLEDELSYRGGSLGVRSQTCTDSRWYGANDWSLNWLRQVQRVMRQQ